MGMVSAGVISFILLGVVFASAWVIQVVALSLWATILVLAIDILMGAVASVMLALINQGWWDKIRLRWLRKRSQVKVSLRLAVNMSFSNTIRRGLDVTLADTFGMTGMRGTDRVIGETRIGGASYRATITLPEPDLDDDATDGGLLLEKAHLEFTKDDVSATAVDKMVMEMVADLSLRVSRMGSPARARIDSTLVTVRVPGWSREVETAIARDDLRIVGDGITVTGALGPELLGRVRDLVVTEARSTT